MGNTMTLKDFKDNMRKYELLKRKSETKYEKLLRRFNWYSAKRQVPVLLSALDYMQSYNGRSINECIVLAMADTYEEGYKIVDDHHECPDDVDCWCERATRGMKEELDAIINSKVLEAIERIRNALPDTTFHGSSIRVKQNIRDNGYADGIYDVRVILKEIEKEYK